jgi:hypothetical protein
VIQGIQGGLYEAKMNQLTKTVTIKRVCSRSGFGKEEWMGVVGGIEEVEGRLSAMMEVVEGASARDIAAGEVVGR